MRFTKSLRDSAQLLHHPEQIPADPLLYDFAFLYAVDDDAHPNRPFIGWLQGHEHSSMCAGGSEPGDYLVSFRHLIVDRIVEIWECLTKLPHELDQRGNALHIPYMRMAVLVANELRTINVRSDCQVPFSPNLIDGASCQSFIFFRGQGRSFPRVAATEDVSSNGIKRMSVNVKFEFTKSRLFSRL